MDEESIAKHIVNSAVEAHRELGGPGLLECVYEEALCYELAKRNCSVERQKVIPIRYKDLEMAHVLRLDLVVENKIIVECKATSAYNAIFESQLLTYLRITSLRLGFIINFGEKLVSKGIKRIVNGY